MTTEQQRPQLLDAALELAGLDWPVFPCVETPGDKAKSPYTKNGFHDATTDPELIQKWWSYRPEALIGLVVPAGICVIDIDPRKGGSRERLEELTGKLPTTATAYSGRRDGGCHLYWLRPPGDLSGIRLKPLGIDLKDADRGYVIAPPSLHPDTGYAYWYEHEDNIAPMPFRLHELLKPEPVEVKRFERFLTNDDDWSGLLDAVEAQTEGGRNDYLFWAACRLGEKGSLDLFQNALIQAALNCGLTEREVNSTIISARRRVGL